MATDHLEQRVAKLEREFETLRDHRVASLEREWADMPELINMSMRRSDQRFSRVFAEISDMKTHMEARDQQAGRIDQHLAGIDGRLESLPRLIAELMAQRDGGG